jgi:hypothetical protein
MDKILSKAPLTSRNSANATHVLPALVSIAYISTIAALIAEHWGLLLIQLGCSRWWAFAICAILKAINISRIFPQQLTSAIGWYAIMELQLGLFGVGMMTMVASLQLWGW